MSETHMHIKFEKQWSKVHIFEILETNLFPFIKNHFKEIYLIFVVKEIYFDQ